MYVTIYHIAEKASVSIATVSRVLNDNPRVAPETRERVLSVAAELGYQPHSVAQNLARRQSNLVSVVVPAMSSHFFMEVLRGIQDALAASGHDVLVHLAKTRSEGVVQLDRALRRGRSAGILIVSTPFLSSLVERLGRAKQAVVLVDCEHPGFNSISVDNKRGGFLAVDHLLDVGCRKIALLMASRSSTPSSDRHAGYVEALASRDMPVDENLVAVCDGEQDGFTESAGFDAMQRLLQHGARPDGVFATSDVQAIGVLRALRDAGLDVPGDVKVVGFDDMPLIRYAEISTMQQPMYRLGSLGAARLLEQLANPDLPIENSVHAPELIPRSTTVPVEAVIA